MSELCELSPIQRKVFLPVHKHSRTVDWELIERLYSHIDDTEEFPLNEDWEWKKFTITLDTD